MKLNIILLQTAILALAAAVTASCKHDHQAPGHNHTEAETKAAPDEIVLHSSMAERFGVKTDTVAAGDFYEVIETSGKIETSAAGTSLVSAPVSGTVHFARNISQGCHVASGATVAVISPSKVAGGDPNRAAKAALDAAQKEVDRMRPLHQAGIVSTRDWNAALAALEQARASYSAGAASGRAVATTSGTVTALNASEGAYVNAGDPVATVASQENLVLRADVPERYFSRIPSVSSAKIKLPYSDTMLDLDALSGRRITEPSGAVATTPGYVPLYFSFRNDGSALAGGYVQVFLAGEPRHGVITLPVEAVSEQQGNLYVYQRVDDECYRKLAVTTGARDGKRVEITSGLTPGMTVVTSGTTAVRLAETSAVAPEGHSHNH